jgi:hypothetical protein
MVNKKSGNIIAVIIAMFSLIAITYTSCTTPAANLNNCEGVLCNNGGYCYVDSLTKIRHCVCPKGFEGPTCATPSVSKYFGTWNLTQKITSADSTIPAADSVSHYIVNLVQSATPTTFFINNFSGNIFYNEIVCTLDSTNSYIFTIDTLSAFHMIFDNYRLLYGYGSISNNDSLIRATFAIKHLTPTTNWVYDTISLYMTHN